MTRALVMLAAAWVLLIGTDAAAQPSASVFPRYESLEANVAFWRDIYSKYTTAQAVLHDSQHLDIVYGVVDLQPPNTPKARKRNRRRIKAAKQEYRRLLLLLAQGSQTANGQARRIARLFGPQAGQADFRKAASRIRSQVGQKDRFRKGLIRSGAWMPSIRQIFAQAGLPAQLAYLPHVESSFNPKAYSKSGAAGVWQFTRATAKRYITVNEYVDERWEPLRASYAAARLLKDNYLRLGNWPLALTAYNHGVAGMLRGQRKYGDAEKVLTRYRSRTFKFASRNFYAEFLAACDVAGDYERYFGALDFDRPADYRYTTLEGFAALNEIAHHLGLKTTDLARYNPSLRSLVRSGQQYIPPGFRLRLPPSPGKNRMQADSLPAQLYKRHQRAMDYYTVQRGDSAGRIARRFKVKLADLVAVNNLNRRATIYTGQRLRLPQSATLAKITTPSNRQPAQILIEHPTVIADSKLVSPKEPPDIVWSPETVIAHARPTAELTHKRVISTQAGGTLVQIQVAHAETLGHYADWLGITTRKLRRLNGLQYGQPVRLGQKLRLPLTDDQAVAFDTRRRKFHENLRRDFFKQHTVAKVRRYQVRSGDNVWHIAQRRFDIPLWLLQLYNPGVDLHTLKRNQHLQIPIITKIS